MLRLTTQPLATDDDLRTALQNAIALEHSTIPPYLTAMLTLSGTSDSVEYARNEITEVIFEEMMHMTLACLGQQPAEGLELLREVGSIMRRRLATWAWCPGRAPGAGC